MSYATLKVKIEKLIELAKKGKEETGVGSRQWWIDMCAEKTFFTYFFGNTSITEVPPIKTSKSRGFTSTFLNCTSLITVPKLDVSSATSFSSTFGNCISLKNISFVEESIKASISFEDSPLLTDESIQSIIDGLATVTKKTKITFHTDTVAKITEAQKTQITNKNWYVG